MATNPLPLIERLNLNRMSDTISLSLWYPQLRLASLQEKLEIVLRQFALHGGEPGVFSATAWPVKIGRAHV